MVKRSDDALGRMEELVKLRGELASLSIRNGVRGTQIDDLVREHVQRLLAPAYEEVGSVEGTLEGLNVHGDNRYFSVYDFLTGKRIRCDFAHRIDVEKIKNALERRVAVYGTLHVRNSGEPARVIAEELHIFPSRDEVPTIEEMRGIIG